MKASMVTNSRSTKMFYPKDRYDCISVRDSADTSEFFQAAMQLLVGVEQRHSESRLKQYAERLRLATKDVQHDVVEIRK